MPFGYGCSSPAPARASRGLARYGPKAKLDERWLRMVAAGLAGQAAASSPAIASVSWRMSDDAMPCIASATISTAVVELWTADSPLRRFVHRRACTRGAVGEDHLVGGRVLHLARERQVRLVARRVTHLKITGELGDVENGNRDGAGNRDGVARVDERMKPRQAPLGAESAQQRLRSAAVLGWLEPHPGEGAPPGLYFG